MESQPREDTPEYFIEVESATETARLLQQDRILTRSMGGIFPSDVDLTQIHDVLDIACGPGGWVVDVAFEHSDWNATGIDISQTTLNYARAMARAQGLDNATFMLMNIFEPLAFPDASFDFVNARLLAGFVPTTFWPTLLKECLRITRPGGYVRITESEGGLGGFSNSPAFERMNEIGARALKAAGNTFSPDGRVMGMTPMLRHLVQNAGYQDVKQAVYVIDFSTGTETHESFRQLWGVFTQLLRPFFIKWQATTEEEFDQIYQQMQLEMLSPDFCALWYMLSAYGRKPAE